MLTPKDYPDSADQLIETIHRLARQGWCPATGGNFSTRIEDDLVMVTQSGRDKTRLTRDDLMMCDLKGEPTDSSLQPSAELALHLEIYSLDSSIRTVLHTHSVTSTVLSRNTPQSDVVFQDFEMQKALSGILTHEFPTHIPIFNNTQDIPALAQEVREAWENDQVRTHGLLVRGHGLYGWGRDMAQAQRHIEALEFLFSCLWQEKLLEARR